MNRTAASVAWAAALLCAAPAPASAQPAAKAPAASPQAPARFTFRQYTAPVPPDWTPVQPASSFRVAQYRVPAARGAADAEAVVFHFGAGQGGSAAANIERWTSQFTSPDGKPVTPKVETVRVGGLPATLVDLRGSYARGVGGGQGAPARPGQVLLAAIVEAPEGNLTFQLHGDQATVERHRKGFVAMVKGFKGG